MVYINVEHWAAKTAASCGSPDSIWLSGAGVKHGMKIFIWLFSLSPYFSAVYVVKKMLNILLWHTAGKDYTIGFLPKNVLTITI